MAKPFKLLLPAGDGIGPEIVAAALEVFGQLCRCHDIGTRIENNSLRGAAREACGCWCRDQTPDMSRPRISAVMPPPNEIARLYSGLWLEL